MDSNWNAPQSGGATGPSSGVGPDSNANPDWPSQLRPGARQRIVDKIMDTLKRHRPVPVPEGINELQNIAVRIEEKFYSAATSLPDYLRKNSLKMLSMENKTQPGLNPSLPNQNRMDPELPQRKKCASSQPSTTPQKSEIIESATSTEYCHVETPPVPNEWQYNTTVPRRSVRITTQHAQAPIVQRAQKRKATGTVKSAGHQKKKTKKSKKKLQEEIRNQMPDAAAIETI